jgi:hypothetical protein
VVVRVLYIYQEQQARVCWGKMYRSEPFGVTNGTRQGSVISPTIWVVYVEELIKEMRRTGVGCTFEGIYVHGDHRVCR